MNWFEPIIIVVITLFVVTMFSLHFYKGIRKAKRYAKIASITGGCHKGMCDTCNKCK